MRVARVKRLDFKRLVLERLDNIGMTQTELVEKLNGRVPPSTVYRFLDRKNQMPIKSDSLAKILEVLRAEVKFLK